MRPCAGERGYLECGHEEIDRLMEPYVDFFAHSFTQLDDGRNEMQMRFEEAKASFAAYADTTSGIPQVRRLWDRTKGEEYCTDTFAIKRYKRSVAVSLPCIVGPSSSKAYLIPKSIGRWDGEDAAYGQKWWFNLQPQLFECNFLDIVGVVCKANGDPMKPYQVRRRAPDHQSIGLPEGIQGNFSPGFRWNPHKVIHHEPLGHWYTILAWPDHHPAENPPERFVRFAGRRFVSHQESGICIPTDNHHLGIPCRETPIEIYRCELVASIVTDSWYAATVPEPVRVFSGTMNELLARPNTELEMLHRAAKAAQDKAVFCCPKNAYGCHKPHWGQAIEEDVYTGCPECDGMPTRAA